MVPTDVQMLWDAQRTQPIATNAISSMTRATSFGDVWSDSEKDQPRTVDDAPVEPDVIVAPVPENSESSPPTDAQDPLTLDASDRSPQNSSAPDRLTGTFVGKEPDDPVLGRDTMDIHIKAQSQGGGHQPSGNIAAKPAEPDATHAGLPATSSGNDRVAPEPLHVPRLHSEAPVVGQESAPAASAGSPKPADTSQAATRFQSDASKAAGQINTPDGFKQPTSKNSSAMEKTHLGHEGSGARDVRLQMPVVAERSDTSPPLMAGPLSRPETSSVSGPLRQAPLVSMADVEVQRIVTSTEGTGIDADQRQSTPRGAEADPNATLDGGLLRAGSKSLADQPNLIERGAAPHRQDATGSTGLTPKTPTQAVSSMPTHDLPAFIREDMASAGKDVRPPSVPEWSGRLQTVESLPVIPRGSQPMITSVAPVLATFPSSTPWIINDEAITAIDDPARGSLFATEPMVQQGPQGTTSVIASSSALPRALAPQVAQQIAAAIAQGGVETTQISLNPEELGRVRISLSTSDTGLTVSILAERPETADLMRRNMESLLKEFADLGYDNPSFTFEGRRNDSGGQSEDTTETGSHDDMPKPQDVAGPPRPKAHSGGLNLTL